MPSNLSNRLFHLLLCAGLCTGTACCGGGGGGGTGASEEPLEAALVTIQAQPESIDTGGRILVQVAIEEVHPDGIVLKIRYPRGLNYYPRSAFLRIERDIIDVTPDFNARSRVAEEAEIDYLVFFLPQSLFGFAKGGELRFQLTAESVVADGTIEVDADLDDPTINNGREFSATEPRFTAEDGVLITVED